MRVANPCTYPRSLTKDKEPQKQIEALQAKSSRENQWNVQMKLNDELKKLKKELEVR